MKIKKLISIIMTMNNNRLDAMSHEEATLKFMSSVNSMYKTILEFQEKLKETNIDLNQELMELPTDTTSIQILVKDENGSPTYAQVKLFPIVEGESLETYNPINGRIDIILRNTNNQGVLRLDVPLYEHVGFARGSISVSKVIGYFIRISKGSEYGVVEQIYPLNHEDSDSSLIEFQLDRRVDLGSLGWVAGDLHHHSIYSSPVYGGTDDVIESAKEVKEAMVSMGLSFGALSDHHNTLNHSDWRNTKETYFLPLVSKEISTSNGHVMSLNVDEDIIYDIPKEEDRSFEYLYQEFIRVTNAVKESNGLAQINHPRDMNPAISLGSEMTSHIEMFDTMEIWNGSIPMMSGTTNEQAYKLWISLLKSDRFIPATTGSDTHNTKANDYNHMYNELLWFVHQVEKGPEYIKNKEVNQLIKLFKESAGTFENWAKENLGTGSVRTYIYCEELNKNQTTTSENTKEVSLEPSIVLKSLKAGKSFLTNGPILLPRVMGKSIGDVVQVTEKQDNLSVSIKYVSNKPLEKLTIQSKKGVLKTLLLSPKYEDVIELNLNKSELEEKDFLIFRAFSDHTNQVITNPIFILR